MSTIVLLSIPAYFIVIFSPVVALLPRGSLLLAKKFQVHFGRIFKAHFGRIFKAHFGRIFGNVLKVIGEFILMVII